MTNIYEKAISILAGNLNSGRSYLITAVKRIFTALNVQAVCVPWKFVAANWTKKYDRSMF